MNGYEAVVRWLIAIIVGGFVYWSLGETVISLAQRQLPLWRTAVPIAIMLTVTIPSGFVGLSFIVTDGPSFLQEMFEVLGVRGWIVILLAFFTISFFFAAIVRPEKNGATQKE